MANSSTPAHGVSRIDVHHHIAPPDYIQDLLPSRHLPPQTMNQGGVDVSLTSITPPGCGLAIWNRRESWPACNDYAAKLRADHPGRFGMFVNLPLPDIEGSLAEIEYGMDELKADGVVMFTSYGDVWLGDPAYDPVYEELNRRKAVIYTHPMTPTCCENLVPGVVDAMIEYQTDTSRAIARVVFGGMAAKFPDIRIIWSHGGGTMPFLVDRFNRWAAHPDHAKDFPGGFLAAARASGTSPLVEQSGSGGSTETARSRNARSDQDKWRLDQGAAARFSSNIAASTKPGPGDRSRPHDPAATAGCSGHGLEYQHGGERISARRYPCDNLFKGFSLCFRSHQMLIGLLRSRHGSWTVPGDVRELLDLGK